LTVAFARGPSEGTGETDMIGFMIRFTITPINDTRGKLRCGVRDNLSHSFLIPPLFRSFSSCDVQDNDSNPDVKIVTISYR